MQLDEEEIAVQLESGQMDEQKLELLASEPASQGAETSDNLAQMSNAEYVAYKEAIYFKQPGATNDLWHQLRSQINSSLMLDIAKVDIERYTKNDMYGYKEREVLKFAIFTKVDPDTMDEMLRKRTYKEMCLLYDASKQSKHYNEVFDKAMANITSIMQQQMNDYNEYKDLIRKEKDALSEENSKLKAMLEDKDVKIKQQDEKINALQKEEKDKEEKAIYDRQIERKARDLMQHDKANRQSVLEDMERLASIDTQAADKKKKSIFKKKKEIVVDVPTQIEKPTVKKYKTINLQNPEPLPEGFDISQYIVLHAKELDSAQLQIITLAYKTQISDTVVKQMIDLAIDGTSSAQLKQLLHFILAKRYSETSKTNVYEEGIFYD